MIHHDVWAFTLARTVELVRAQPEAREDHKAALRTLVSLSAMGPFVLRREAGALSVDGTAVSPDVPNVDALLARMAGHGVAEVGVAQNAVPKELLDVVLALAVAPSDAGGGAVERMRQSGAKTVRMMSVRSDDTQPRRVAGVTAAYDAVSVQTAIEEAEMNDSALGAALAQLQASPHGMDALHRVSAVAEQVAAFIAANKVTIALRAVAQVAWLEENAPESVRTSYQIVLKRMLPRDVIEKFARLAPDQRYAGDVVKVMQFIGVEGTEVLLGLLAAASNTGDGRMYLNALREMREGLHLAVDMLEHKQWFVARNAADLLGELRVGDAVAALAKALEHSEPKVQRSAAVALAKIGTPAAALHLRRTLKEGDSALRGLVAAAIGGRSSGALAMPLVLAADTEADPELLGEYFRALGRIGSKEALQALAKAAEPGGSLLRRKPSGPRLAAVEGMRIAGAPALKLLEALVNDGDKDVRAAAVAAVDQIHKASVV